MMMVPGDEEGPNSEKKARKKWRPPPAAVPIGTPTQNYPQRCDRATGAQLIGISYWSLVKLTDEGVIPDDCVYHYGRRRILYDRDRLLAWRPKKKAG